MSLLDQLEALTLACDECEHEGLPFPRVRVTGLAWERKAVADVTGDFLPNGPGDARTGIYGYVRTDASRYVLRRAADGAYYLEALDGWRLNVEGIIVVSMAHQKGLHYHPQEGGSR